jgi:hypothetical protein
MRSLKKPLPSGRGVITIGPYERLECPADIQQELTDRFGVNVYGDPVFRIIWGQSDTFRVLQPSGFYMDQTCGGNVAKWLVQKWSPPIKWGTREIFNIVNADPFYGLPLYEFPEFGMYETVTSVPHLEHAIIDWVIPYLIKVLALSDEQLKAAKEWAAEVQNREEVEKITDKLMEALPTRYGPTSYGRGGCRTSVLTKKMADIEREWRRQEKAIKSGRMAAKGFSQADRVAAADFKI